MCPFVFTTTIFISWQGRCLQVQSGHRDWGHRAGGDQGVRGGGGEADPLRDRPQEEGGCGQSLRQLWPRREGGGIIKISWSTCFVTESWFQELGWKSSRTLTDMCRDMWNWQTKNPKGFAGWQQRGHASCFNAACFTYFTKLIMQKMFLFVFNIYLQLSR